MGGVWAENDFTNPETLVNTTAAEGDEQLSALLSPFQIKN